MTLKEFYGNLAFEFVKKYSPEILELARKVSTNPKQLIKSYILKHMEYGTIVMYWEGQDLVGVCNFDVTDETAHIKNCVVHPDYRNKDILKKIIIKGLKVWPFLQYITFEREVRNDKRPRKLLISKIIKSAVKPA